MHRFKQFLASLKSSKKTHNLTFEIRGQMIRQIVDGVSNYLMSKDAEWDPEQLKKLKDTYYKVLHAGPGTIL